MPEKSTISRYETFKQVEKSSGGNYTPPALLYAPELPEEAYPLWKLFTRLSDINYTEIDAYQRLTGEQLGQWEIDVIMELNLIRKSPPEWQMPNIPRS